MAVLTELTFLQKAILLKLVNRNCFNLLAIALCCSFSAFLFFSFFFLSPDLTSLSSMAPLHPSRRHLQHMLLPALFMQPPDLVLPDATKLTCRLSHCTAEANAVPGVPLTPQTPAHLHYTLPRRKAQNNKRFAYNVVCFNKNSKGWLKAKINFFLSDLITGACNK